MGNIHRLWLMLILGVMCLGVGCAQRTGRAVTVDSRIDPEGEVDVLERNMAGHESVRVAQLKEDTAKAGSENHEAPSTAEKPSQNVKEPEASPDDGYPEETLYPDPLEPMNRAFFKFNDAAYFWFFKPVAEGYSTVMPDVMRISIRNFFTNLSMPIRLVSSLLQGKLKSAGMILVRFMVNTSAGFLGFQDVAKQALNYPIQDEDLGQVLAFYGIGPGFYLNLPLFGGQQPEGHSWLGGGPLPQSSRLHSGGLGAQSQHPSLLHCQQHVSSYRRVRGIKRCLPGSLRGHAGRIFSISPESNREISYG